MKTFFCIFTITIFFLFFTGCKKEPTNYTNPVKDCSQNIFESTIDSSQFKATEQSINTNYGPTTFTIIYAKSNQLPPYSYFNFSITNSTPGTYYLGELGVKKDSVNYFNGEASYTIHHTASITEGYMTDSLYSGILTITEKDEQNKQLYGTFSFNCPKYNTNDTILVSISGSFQGCY